MSETASMRRNGGLIPVLLLAFLCLWFAGLRQDALIGQREEYHLDSGRPLENAPPLVAFTTVVLGGFGGFLADILWLRVSYLQEEGKYLEIVQLADWITKLEPRCAEIWSFHAWNMAYNVSVAMAEPEDRWLWVYNGIKLLRDEGMVYNPTDASMYLNLGWMFQNKIRGEIDPSHAYYKFRWAEEMKQLFDGAHPDYGNVGSNPSILQRMEKDYKLIPGIMKKVDDEYGPLDWRLPEAHAIYWAYRGMQRSEAKYMIQYDRMIYQSMVLSFTRGRLVSAENAETLALGPNLDIFDATVRTFDRVLQKYQLDDIRPAYVTFLSHAVVMFDSQGRQEKALEAFELLRAKFPSTDTTDGFESFLSRIKADLAERSRQTAP